MKRAGLIVLLILTTSSRPAVYGQQEEKEANRVRTSQMLAQLLEKAGPDIKVSFSQSQKQPFNYLGSLKTGLVNAESFEIVISVTPNDTIGFRIYPHYKNGYINIDKAKNSAALMRLLLKLSDQAFLFWGVDEAGDIFTGYTFTLESGFPEESIKTVLSSIVNSDKFVGEMRPILESPVEDVMITTPERPATPSAKTKVQKPEARARRGTKARVRRGTKARMRRGTKARVRPATRRSRRH